MATVALTQDALDQLTGLIDSHRLPVDTRSRLARSLTPLAEFPEFGAELGGRHAGRRFLLGPWRWMIIVYRYYPEQDLVAILAIVDGRASTSPLASR